MHCLSLSLCVYLFTNWKKNDVYKVFFLILQRAYCLHKNPLLLVVYFNPGNQHVRCGQISGTERGDASSENPRERIVLVFIEMTYNGLLVTYS